MLYKLAISMIQGVGSRNLRKLMDACEEASLLFPGRSKVPSCLKEMHPDFFSKLQDPSTLRKAEKELEYMEKNGIHALWYRDSAYPSRLRDCEDAPLILYVKGNTSLNTKKSLSIVGTRKATSYGLKACESILSGLQTRGHRPLIISGLAYGIDICAHRCALHFGLPTVAVLGHSFEEIYPSEHRETARDILNRGALVTEFHSLDKSLKSNFVRRNRIIAGISEATLVVESAIKGGSLITASLAYSYQRDVLCVPGRISDAHSAGCNQWICNQKALLTETAEDIEKHLGWQPENLFDPPKSLQSPLEPAEIQVINALKPHERMDSQSILQASHLSSAEIHPILLHLELEGWIESLPGGFFRIASGVMI